MNTRDLELERQMDALKLRIAYPRTAADARRALEEMDRLKKQQSREHIEALEKSQGLR